MTECMVTHGRGLDDFVRAEVLEKIPNASNVRHLNEGKIAFRVSSSGIPSSVLPPSDVKTDTTLKQNVELKGTEVNNGCDFPPQEEADNEGIQREEEKNVHRNEITTDLGMASTEKEDDESLSVDSLSDIFNLRLVERVFILLHCEDVDPKATHQTEGEESNVDAALTDYENKFFTLVKNIEWERLAARMRRMRRYQDGVREASCRDPHSCPGSLRKRQARKEIGEKRLSLGVSRGTLSRRYNPHTTTHIINRDRTREYRDTNVKASKETRIIKKLKRGDEDTNSKSATKRLRRDDKDFFTEHVPINETEEEKNTSVNCNENTVNNIGREDRDTIINSSEETPIKKIRSDEEKNTNVSQERPTFRVSSRVSGPVKERVTVRWISNVLSHQLQSVTSLVPDWRHPLIDLYVNITVSHFIVGVSLSPRPLSLRPYIPHITLRSTISHLMATLSHTPLQATVLDPMCGGGSILLETAMNFDVSHVIASDISRDQLEVARCNLNALHVPVTLLQADAQGLPLQDSSISSVLCDFPFGLKHKLRVGDKHLLARVLTETHRLLMCGGRAVFLLSPKQHQSLSDLTFDHTKDSSTTNRATTSERLTLLESHLVSLGETSAFVSVMVKEPYTPP